MTIVIVLCSLMSLMYFPAHLLRVHFEQGSTFVEVDCSCRQQLAKWRQEKKLGNNLKQDCMSRKHKYLQATMTRVKADATALQIAVYDLPRMKTGHGRSNLLQASEKFSSFMLRRAAVSIRDLGLPWRGSEIYKKRDMRKLGSVVKEQMLVSKLSQSRTLPPYVSHPPAFHPPGVNNKTLYLAPDLIPLST